MQDFSFSAYFFPRPPQEWTAENICQANRLSHPLREWGFAFNVLGGVGAAFATGSMVARKLRGGTLTSALIYFEITSLALIALGICFQRLASRHTQGLTHEHKIGVALDKLKQSFNQFPVLESEEELQKKLGDDVDFKSTLAGDAVSDANEIYSSLARVYYRPTKDLVPRLRIAEGLTVDQKVDLLDSSYHKGIILHFRDFEGQARHRNFPGINDLNSRDLTEKCLEQINQSFACSIRFLAKHLQPLDEQKLPFINEQLRALSFSWYLDGEKKVLNPCIYLEDAETVVIPGKLHEEMI